jgi:hypothetical protein
MMAPVTRRVCRQARSGRGRRAAAASNRLLAS